MTLPLNFTKHARIRAQQRCLPPVVDDLLSRFGEESHLGNGLVRLILTKRSAGRASNVSKLSATQCFQYRGAYQIESLRTGQIVTTGWTHKRVRHK